MRIYSMYSFQCDFVVLYALLKSKSTIWNLLNGLFTLELFVNTSWFMSKGNAATHRCFNLNLARLCDQFVCLLPENEIKIKDYCLLDWKVRNWEHKKSTHVRRKSRFKRCILCTSRTYIYVLIYTCKLKRKKVLNVTISFFAVFCHCFQG